MKVPSHYYCCFYNINKQTELINTSLLWQTLSYILIYASVREIVTITAKCTHTALSILCENSLQGRSFVFMSTQIYILLSFHFVNTAIESSFTLFTVVFLTLTNKHGSLIHHYFDKLCFCSHLFVSSWQSLRASCHRCLVGWKSLLKP